MKIPILSSLFKSRASPKNSFWQNSYAFFFGPTPSGKTVNERTAMATSAVYACVRVLSETIASLPLHVYRRTGQGKEKAMDHGLYYLLHDEPNPEMTSFVFRETLMGHLLLWGNAYAQIIRDGRGKVIGLYPLLPDRMEVSRTDQGELYYRYQKEGREYLLRREEVLHIPGLSFDGLVGYSPIAMSKNAIGMALATEEYGSKLFANDARPSVVLEHPGILKDPAKIRDSWNQIYRGSENAHKVAVLEEGMSVKTLSMPPEQAQFLETRKFQIEEICRIFRVPPHLVANLERATFSNIEHQSISFVVHTIRPWLVRLEQAFNKALFSGSEKKEYFVGLVVDGLLRGDYESRMRGFAVGIQNGFLSLKTLVTARKEFPLLTENIKLLHENPRPYHFSNECDMINRIVTGMSAKQFREANGLAKGTSIRPYLTDEQIELLETLQKVDIGLLVSVPDYQQRKRHLEWYKMKLLEKIA